MANSSNSRASDTFPLERGSSPGDALDEALFKHLNRSFGIFWRRGSRESNASGEQRIGRAVDGTPGAAAAALRCVLRGDRDGLLHCGLDRHALVWVS